MQIKKMSQNQKSEIRHSKNLLNEKEKFERKDKDNKEKIMKKYISFYWNKKNIEKNRQEKFKEMNNKYSEKYGKLEEIERQDESNRNKLIEKIKKNDYSSRHQEQMKINNQKLEELKEKREVYINTCKNNLKTMQKELTEGTHDIIEYQTLVLAKRSDKDRLINSRRINSMGKTIYYQMNFEKNLKKFFKRLEGIKSSSIYKHSIEERKKRFLKMKRDEALAKKREEEERLLNQKTK